MLHLIQSNKMETLLAHLVESISTQSTSVLLPKTILVQSPGMAQWLKIQLGQAMGIAANLRFPLPSSFIWEQYQRVFDDLPEQSAFSKVDMTWKIMALLPKLCSQSVYQPLNEYLQGDKGLKSFLLSQKIADVFDQYQMYRPHWLLAWEQGDDQPDDCQLGQHYWQPALWRELVHYTQELGESTYHRANLHDTLVQSLATGKNTESSQPIYIFGLSAIPRQQLEVFQALATHTDVWIFWCNPSAHYWGDLVDEKHIARTALEQNSATESDSYFEVGNPLLSSWGKLGRDYLEMLMQIEPVQHDTFVDTEPRFLLQHIQSEIMNLTMRGSAEPLSAEELLGEGQQFPRIELEQSDRSLTIQKCHSIVRELEVLHDHLLSCFAEDPTLQPSDIIVMIPDVAQYAPYIEGVFGAANTSHFIPYAISDRNAADESTLIDSFLQLLCLHQSRMSVSELLSILDVPSIAQRFEIDPMEMTYIRFWLTDSGVRWGWDGEDKGRWQVPENGQNTWLFGLNRLLAGYAMDASDLYQQQDSVIAPYRDIEGQQAVALGKLFVFSQAISDMLAFCTSTQTISEKVEAALGFLQRFYAITDSEQVYINQLRQALEDMSRHQTQYPHRVDQDVFVQHLQQGLRDKGVGQRFLAGYVNFCTLMPMRSIPFKRVCMLGMNDGDYPRQTVPVGFDLMRISPTKKGDRSRRLDDRYLFLEALLCAREQLYISYLGMSSKDNSERNPSVLISELLEYCEAVFCFAQSTPSSSQKHQDSLLDHLICEHPLQPFSQRYFDGANGHLKSYANHWLSAAKSQFQGTTTRHFLTDVLPDEDDVQHTVEIDILIRAWQNPAKFLFDQRWRCNLNLYFEQPTEHEPFAVDGLSRYGLIDTLLHHQLREDCKEDLEHLQATLVAEGKLPAGAGAQIAFDSLVTQADGVVSEFGKLSQSRQSSTFEVDLALSNTRLVGWLDSVYHEDLILCRAGKLRSKDKLALWIAWLAICASKGTQGRAAFVCLDKVYALKAVEQGQATTYLEQLVRGYQSMTNQPVYCFPDASFEWLKTGDVAKTIGVFQGNSFSSGEGDEVHIARLCPNLEAVFEEFVQYSTKVYSPIVEHEVKL